MQGAGIYLLKVNDLDPFRDSVLVFACFIVAILDFLDAANQREAKIGLKEGTEQG